MTEDRYRSTMHYINGSLTPAHSAARITLVDPSTEEAFGEVASGDATLYRGARRPGGEED